MKTGSGSENLNLDAGQLSLDFANTMGWHASEHPVEKLHSYHDVLTWSANVGLITGEEKSQLSRASKSHAKQALQVYNKSIELREALYRIFSAFTMKKRPDASDLEIFNKALVESLSHLRVGYDRGKFRWEWADAKNSLEQILWPVVRSAAELLNSEDLERVGRCEDDRGCGWLFLDTSHNRTRRWCGTSCGNRAKVRSFRERARAHD
ncbi:ABATE domain-containing protein [Candidatus Acetothermia bacterium]|nr:ABATE domain-containing protein [Candidatus Acetothermia bacterium]MBI3642598.1 ABATE domain-containing protein [Candidatus Acetothermia bacterium]